MEEVITYPIEFDLYFKENEVYISQIPEKYKVIKQDNLPQKRIKSTKVFYQYLKQESEFWDYSEISKNHIVSSYKGYYIKAFNDLNAAIRMYETNVNQAIKNFITVVNYVKTYCVLSSNTQLAKIMKKLKDKGSYFFYGFEHAMIPTNNPSNYQYAGWHEGFYVGMQYVKAIQSIEEYVEANHSSYSEAVIIAEKEISDLVEKYTTLYHDQEKRINDLWLENEKILASEHADITEYFDSKKRELDTYLEQKEKNLVILEQTYEQKLKLSKPAEYWKSLSDSYAKKGNIWLLVSSLIAIITIAVLVLFIIFTPDLFNYDGDLYLILKNTALLTVVTSIAIYMLRITVKMTMSSYHLSRDSKEREQLAYFYLSLIQNDGVSDNERAIILNSLFSRSDTGLLKGDSSPVMSTNVTDIINKVKSAD